MVLNYDIVDHIGATQYQNASPQYNGNISWMMWRNAGLTAPYSLVGYSFDYDKTDRLKKADYGYYSNDIWQTTTNGDINNLNYDKNGNIQSLTRYGLTNGLMDQFTYNYNEISTGNRLAYVDDAASTWDYNEDIDDQSSGNYIYDGNGNIKADIQKNIASIDYDQRNLQSKIIFGLIRVLSINSVDIDNTAEYKAIDTLKTINSVNINSGANVTFKAGAAITLNSGFSVKRGATFTAVIDTSLQNQTTAATVKYVYDAQGNRVKKEYSDYSSEKYYIRDASGNVIAVYDENGDQNYINLLGADVFGKYASGEGYSYYIKDHLGSTRVVVDETGTVMEAYEYYPFGRISRSYINGTGADEKFTGKELDNDNDERMYYFGARYYDGDLGKWLSVDPLADKYPGWSPYNYSLNNSLNMVDPDGRDAIPIVFKDYKISAFGRKWSNLGHAGVLLINNKTGYANYYEYGRYNSPEGEVRSYAIPNVVMDKETGMPTEASLNKVLNFISKKSGQKGDITGAYIKNDNFDDMKKYAEGRKKQNNDPNRDAYDFLKNNCGTFMQEALEAGGVDTPLMMDPRPNSYIEELRDEYKNVDHKMKEDENR